MRKHHKEDNSGWGSSFRKSSDRGTIPSSFRGSNPRWEVTFSIDVNEGEIHHMQDRELDSPDAGQRVRCLERENKDMFPGGAIVIGGA
jgi:hypothetical protein